MTFDRRQFLKCGAAAMGAAALPGLARAAAFRPEPDRWRTFDLTTSVAIPGGAEGPIQAWLPLPSVYEPGWSLPSGNRWSLANGRAEIVTDPRYGAQMLHVVWEPGPGAGEIEITSRVMTRNRDGASQSAPLDAEQRRLYLAPTSLIPTDGIVKATSDRIVGNTRSQEGKARAIYEWVVENTHRDASVRGCGAGDIAGMLASGNLGGKCADINALYVGLARAADLPARDVYGIRVAPSAFGYKSLGANSAVVTKAQHCRAEVHIDGKGWLPVDPADVRKVALEEPPANLPLQDPKVAAARATLFGAWEMNWVAFNRAHDVRLPGAREGDVAFLMYPQAETAAGRCDCLDADGFKYSITAAEVTA